MTRKIGIIAGNGTLPTVIAKAARAQNCQVFVCAIQGEADKSLTDFADEIEWVVLGELAKLVKFFKQHDVSEVIMAGKITKTNLFKGEVRPDFEMIKMMAGIRNHEDNTLLGTVANYLESKEIRLLSSVTFLDAELPKSAVLSKEKPSKSDLEEIKFGWKIAKQIAGLDIGQTVVTKKKAVVAVEAIEGTDQAILRAGELVSKGAAVFKVAKPNQDMRFDVPTIGLTTLESMIQAGARMLVIEAGKTILLDQEEFLKKANQHKLIVIVKEN